MILKFQTFNKLFAGWFVEWVTISLNTGVKFKCPVKNGGAWIINSEPTESSRRNKNDLLTLLTRQTRHTGLTQWTQRTGQNGRTGRSVHKPISPLGPLQSTLTLPCQKSGETVYIQGQSCPSAPYLTLVI